MENKYKEALVGIAKACLSNVPYAGAMLNELIFDIRGRLVQRRINDFIESFLTYITDIGIIIEDSRLTSEEFNDIYYSIIRKVVETNSKHKLKLFKQILASNTKVIYESDFRETFLDLVLKLDYIQIEILKLYRDTGRSGEIDVFELTSRSFKERILQIIIENYPTLTTFEAEGKYEFYICDLISKALLIDKKSVGNTYSNLNYEGLTMLYITDFGKEFLNFILSK